MSVDFDYDIIVIGGGPGGLSTALHVARDFPHLIPRLLILEKARYPRPKLCGGGLVADAEVLLERLGLDVSEVPHVDAAAIHFDFAGQGLTFSVPTGHALRIIRRDEFDAWLAGKAHQAGVEIRQGVTVKNVQVQRDGVLIESDAGNFHAQVVVGADGSNGVTRRCALPQSPLQTARLLEVLTPADGQPALPGQHEADHAYFDFRPVPRGIAGYIWDFPTQVKGESKRCWGIYDSNFLAGQKRPPLRSVLAEEMERNGLEMFSCELQGHPIRWFSPFHPISTSRVILVGDAAGADPLFGEGISMALGYGRLAAQALQQALLSGDFSFRHYRQQVLRSPLGKTLTIRWAIAQVLYHLSWEWFQKRFWRVFRPLILLVAWKWVLNWGKRI
ncbi:MAG: NAD(P)/FAD-dependent oxidoreductase [Anaerolineae bacterium]